MCVLLYSTGQNNKTKKSFNCVCQLKNIFNVLFSRKREEEQRDNNKVMRIIIQNKLEEADE